MEGLKAKGVPTMIYYRIPLHLQPVFKHLGYAPGSMPVSEAAAASVVSLPMHPYMDEATSELVIAAVKEVLAG